MGGGGVLIIFGHQAGIGNLRNGLHWAIISMWKLDQMADVISWGRGFWRILGRIGDGWIKRFEGDPDPKTILFLLKGGVFTLSDNSLVRFRV